MAKTIKFYMICDDHPVRTIDDLREHFGMEDVLDYYKRGIFQRWLKVRGYEAELEAVNQIDSKDDSEALTKLIQIFDVEKDPAKIAEFIGILKYNEEKAKAAAEKKKKEEEEKARAVIEKTENVEEERSNAEEQKMNKDGQNANAVRDMNQYLSLVDTILENSTNKAVIKNAVKEIAENYRHVFKQDYVNLFYLLYECAPMAIFVMLSFGVMREKYLSDDAMRSPKLPENTLGIDSSILLSKKLQEAKDKRSNNTYMGPVADSVANLVGILSKSTQRSLLDMHLTGFNDLRNKRTPFKTLLNEITKVNRLKDILTKDLKEFSENTLFNWRKLEPKGKKCMVLKLAVGDHVCPSGQKDANKILNASDCNDKFILLDGIDIRSRSYASTYYMEV